jgi:hypothetical protein
MRQTETGRGGAGQARSVTKIWPRLHGACETSRSGGNFKGIFPWHHGKPMGLIYPHQSKTAHWDGALQRRLRRAPLEEFLKTHSLKIAHGAARDCDNVVRASVYLIQGGLEIHFCHREEGLAESQYGLIGRLACLTTRAVIELIGEPGSWRIPALLSTAQLLSPWIGLHASAYASASFVHQFTVRLQDAAAQDDNELTAAVSAALQHNDRVSLFTVTEMIEKRLSATAIAEPRPLHNASRQPRSLSV